MKGHVRERRSGSGNWYAVISMRDPASGKRKLKWHSLPGCGGKRKAQIEAAKLVAAVNAGTYTEPSKLTFAAYLEQWHVSIKPRISARTHERYGEIIRKNIVPPLGAVPLVKLHKDQIKAAYAEALNSGRRDGQGGLSPATVVYMHRIIRQALGEADLPRNPSDGVKPPKIERDEMSTYDVPQTAELLDTLRASRLFVPVVLAVLCGLRRGEICALRWRHVDFATAQITVAQSAEQTAAEVRYKEPKSGRGRSVAMSATVAAELRAYRVRQAEDLLRLGVRQTDDTFVYTREDGEPMQPRSLTHAWQVTVVTTALPRIRFHDLRHAHATHLLKSGVHPKVASERLGHSKVGITLDLYSHVLPGMQEDAAARVDDALQAAINKGPKAIG
jgi:integrase